MISRKEAENCLGREVKIKVRNLGEFEYNVKGIDENVVIVEKEIDGEKFETCFFINEIEKMSPID